MTKLRVLSFGLSIDGYGAGPRQDLNNPLGVAGQVLLYWSRASRIWRKRHGAEGGDESGVDEELVREDSGTLGRGSWAVTISVQFGDPGQIIAGKAGGETTHPSTLPSLY